MDAKTIKTLGVPLFEKIFGTQNVGLYIELRVGGVQHTFPKGIPKKVFENMSKQELIDRVLPTLILLQEKSRQEK